MSERYALRIAKTAEKDLHDLSSQNFAQIVKKILSLQGDSKPQDSKNLQYYPGGYRAVQGEYCILYVIDETLKTVDIFRIGLRNAREVKSNRPQLDSATKLTLKTQKNSISDVASS